MNHASGALRRAHDVPVVSLVGGPTPVEELARLRHALDARPLIRVKRDDQIPFGGGGNKLRKLEPVLAEAVASEADTLVTVGSVQSNHARATAAAAARLGLACHLLVDGPEPGRATANALLARLFGASVRHIGDRARREDASADELNRLRRDGRRPFLVALGASTPLGAIGYVRAVSELLEQTEAPPDVIVHATSSGGTQAGLLIGCALHGLGTRVIGVSADEPRDQLTKQVAGIIRGTAEMLGVDPADLLSACPIEVDDGFVGDGYAVPSAESDEAQRMAARTEALLVDQTYGGKALAALIAYLRAGLLDQEEQILFWHTGGQLAVFA